MVSNACFIGVSCLTLKSSAETAASGMRGVWKKSMYLKKYSNSHSRQFWHSHLYNHHYDVSYMFNSLCQIQSVWFPGLYICRHPSQLTNSPTVVPFSSAARLKRQPDEGSYIWWAFSHCEGRRERASKQLHRPSHVRSRRHRCSLKIVSLELQMMRLFIHTLHRLVTG